MKMNFSYFSQVFFPRRFLYRKKAGARGVPAIILFLLWTNLQWCLILLQWDTILYFKTMKKQRNKENNIYSSFLLPPFRCNAMRRTSNNCKKLAVIIIHLKVLLSSALQLFKTNTKPAANEFALSSDCRCMRLSFFVSFHLIYFYL